MNPKTSACLAAALIGALALAPSPARADDPGPPKLGAGEHFTIDPVLDGLLVGGGATFDFLLGQILATGELRPSPPGNPNVLPSIDRGAVTQTIDPSAGRNSDIGLYAAYGYAVLDTALSGVRDGRWAMLGDAILYAESTAITGALTDATKIAVRRPRPIDYQNCGTVTAQMTDACKNGTDLQLSFFSGHASAMGAITGTATYLAFVRSGARSLRPWITLGVGTLLTAFVSYERVRSGEHFPTDVIMGSLAGAGVGILVPHLHRRPHYHDNQLEASPVLICYMPVPGGGGGASMQLRF
jgi:membrane-associated phospholipid phosphatase